MWRSMHAALLVMSASALVFAVPSAGRQEDDDEPPPIKELMVLLNEGPEALTSAIGRNLDRDTPDWKTLGEQCKKYEENVVFLGKNVPPRGEQDSWERLTAAYLEDSRSLREAVKAKDRKAALAAHGRIEQACARCHIEHKP